MKYFTAIIASSACLLISANVLGSHLTGASLNTNIFARDDAAFKKFRKGIKTAGFTVEGGLSGTHDFSYKAETNEDGDVVLTQKVHSESGDITTTTAYTFSLDDISKPLPDAKPEDPNVMQAGSFWVSLYTKNFKKSVQVEVTGPHPDKDRVSMMRIGFPDRQTAQDFIDLMREIGQ